VRRPDPAVRPARAARDPGCAPWWDPATLGPMRDVSSPVLDRMDAGRGELHALQVLVGLFLLLVIL
jgi:hypothetical protein